MRNAFLKRGHIAFSCDLLPSRCLGEHYQEDIAKLLKSTRGNWDLIILHPDCTQMALSGNPTYGRNKPKAAQREIAIEWTWNLWIEATAHCPRVALENPMSAFSRKLKRSQEIHPWQFGHPEQKTTWLWLHNLPPLIPTNDVHAEMMLLPKVKRERVWSMAPGPNRKRDRSVTFQGIADAFAEQWGNL